ncbi:MAG: glycosyltransferase family 39 protein [Candidatus Omnitrophica bacterium]|nr:glycosyltransferase family 39 protein [Candidatus Omnitrophota bacterium]
MGFFSRLLGNRQALCLAFLFFSLLPFLPKAFCIDEPFFLKVAEHILTDWRHPYNFSINWYGTAESAYDIAAGAPLQAYFLAAVMKGIGRAEWQIHLACFLFVVMAWAGIRILAGRFTRHPHWAALFVLISPAVFVTSQACMPDMSAFAFEVMALACFIRGFDRQKPILLCVSGGLAGVAFLIKYHAGVLIPLVMIYAVLRDRKRFIPAALYFAAAWMAVVSVWGSVHPIQTGFSKRFALSHNWLSVGLVTLVLLNYLGAAALIPAAFFLPLWPDRRSRMQAWTCILLGILAALPAKQSGYPPSSIILLVVFLSTGLWVVAQMLRKGRRDDLFLCLWLALIFASCFQTFPAVRRVLFMLPPMIFWFVRTMEASAVPWIDRHRRLIFSGIASGTWLLSLGVSHADYRQADVYRQFARSLREEADHPGGRLLFAGHWGFQYYMEQRGAKPIDLLRDHLNGGDTLFVAQRPVPLVHVENFAQLGSVFVKSVPDNSFFPIRTLSADAGVNFYGGGNAGSGRLAFLPYGISREPLETFFVLHVGPKSAFQNLPWPRGVGLASGARREERGVPPAGGGGCCVYAAQGGAARNIAEAGGAATSDCRSHAADDPFSASCWNLPPQ